MVVEDLEPDDGTAQLSKPNQTTCFTHRRGRCLWNMLTGICLTIPP
ncbi:MAG: hypothetical protein LBU68_01535 [Rickettsiales bacterium]|nr:hypothetical protein [Rickettsiales bacterium]